jgi:Sec-independent protein translocase protein TatA
MLASWGEIAVVLGAGALLYGPKDLPRVARAAGRMVGNSRRLTRQCGCPHASV